MTPIDQFRQAALNLRDAAIASGVDRSELHRILIELAGIDAKAAQEAAENLDGLIDGEDEDDIGSTLSPARDILRVVAGVSLAKA